MEQNDKITIIDVARKAGVSKGTVDRVVHNRGDVSKKSAEKVRKAIEELNYQPNLYASLLASRKARVIACLLPKFEKGDYWEKLHSGFLQGEEAISSLNIQTQVFLYDQYSPESFNTVAAEMLATSPAGVILQPFFRNDSMVLAEKLRTLGIPFVFVDTKIEDTGYFAYYGMPMYKSGRLCAFLLTERLEADEVTDIAIVRVNRDKSRRSDPTMERRAGFMDYIEAYYPECRIHQVFINANDPGQIKSVMEDFAQEHPDIKLLVMFNSRIKLLSDFLASHPVPGRRVIGFDDLELNVEAVKKDLVTILISEHIEDQTKLAVTTLADYLLRFKCPAKQDNYMHMDVLTKFNLENY